MKIPEILKHNSAKGIAFEFFPPRNQQNEEALRRTVTALAGYNPLYASMTCGAGGTDYSRTSQAVDILLEHKQLTVMPHITCISVRSKTIKFILDAYKKLGIENIMALRGDLVSGAGSQECDFTFARDLVAFIKSYDHFAIGVAVYPQGHIEAGSLQEDLDYAKEKIDAGADFAITQMFFDNSYYYDFLKRIRKRGISIPILPGIFPLTNIVKIKEFASICKATIPRHIDKALSRFSDKPQEMEKAGIEFTIKQCKDLMANGVRQLHFFTMNKASVMKEILDAII